MFDKIKKMLGFGPSADLRSLIAGGAQIVDVRTKGKYAGGSVKGSVNIPLDMLKSRLGELKKDKPVITCCASGMRSASARSILLASGFAEVYNGGGWQAVKSLQQ